MNGSILVVGRVSGRIAELADSCHNVYGVRIYDKPQWLSDVDFYFCGTKDIFRLILYDATYFMVYCSHHFSETYSSFLSP